MTCNDPGVARLVTGQEANNRTHRGIVSIAEVHDAGESRNIALLRPESDGR